MQVVEGEIGSYGVSFRNLQRYGAATIIRTFAWAAQQWITKGSEKTGNQ